jgi:hypothetical protein
VKLGSLLVIYVLLGAVIPLGFADAAGPTPAITIDSFEITDIGNGTLLIKGQFTATGLNTPIPESDHVTILIEVKTAPSAKYPVFSEYYNIAQGCVAIGDRCLSEEEEHGVKIQSIVVFDSDIRDAPVWQVYGGLGEWEKNAPNTVTMKFEARIPKVEANYGARIHAVLKHVIGGPNAYWPGITYYHDAQDINLGNSRESIESTSSATSTSTGSFSTTSTTSNTGKSSKSLVKKEQTAGDASKFKNPFEGVRVEGMLSKEAKVRMKITLDKLKGIGSAEGLETVEVKTPYGKDIKVYQKDENVNAKKSSSLWFKLKYYTGKALDKVIDSASGALDSLVEKVMPSPVGLFKDYVKAYKDSQLFQGDEATQKTMNDLHVSMRSAESYNQMSGIENRELSLSPYKNAVPSSPMTKPVELTIGALGTGFKKCLAHDYEWEFGKTAERALFYKKLGMKYRDIILRTIADVEEETSYDHKVQTMNAQSKGEYKNQETRIRYYLNKLYREGKI